MKNYKGKVALVTGAGSGIGKQLSLKLARLGCNLLLTDVNQLNLNEVSQQCDAMSTGVTVRSFSCDVSKLEKVQALREFTQEQFSGLDLLINNAGVAFKGTVEDTEYHDYDWIMGINFWGVVYGCKELLPLLRLSADAHIVNVSSIFGLIALPEQSAYNASKFAVRGFTESLQQELSNTNISVSCVLPGGVKTNIVDSSRQSASNKADAEYQDAEKEAFKQMLKTTPEQAACIILDGVKANKTRILVGRDARHLDGLARLLPALYTKVIAWGVSYGEKKLKRQLTRG